MHVRRSVAALLTLGLLGAGGVLALPAEAATTVAAQLTLTGAATSSAPTGGAIVAAHPGDRVSFSSAAAPTAGLPASVGSLLGGLLGNLAGVQVTIISSAVPGLAKGTTFGTCTSAGEVDATTTPALAKGTYPFTYTLQSLNVLPLLGSCSVGGPLALNGNQLKSAGVSVNAANVYSVQVVVAEHPPTGIALQLPSVSVNPNVAGIQLPKVTVPGVTTNPITIPGVTTPTTTTTTTTPPASTGKTYGNSPVASFPDGSACCGLTADLQGTVGSPTSGVGASAGTTVGPGGNQLAAPRTTLAAHPAKKKAGTSAFNFASNKAPAAQMPVLLAILALLALAVVTATYARLYLLRRG